MGGVVGTVLVIKAVKLSFVVWRQSAVNTNVQAQAETLLVPTKVTTTDHTTCPGCTLQLGDEDFVVNGDCDCVLHLSCFIDAATEQHGVHMPRSLDVCDAVTLFQRLVGLEKVHVENVTCPGCGVVTSSWGAVRKAVQGEDGPSTSTAHGGDARRQLPSLRSVVDEARAGVRQGDVRDVQRSFMTNFL